MLELQHAHVAGRLEDINLVVTGGQHWHVLGENGAGKSTLLQVMAGLLETGSGNCWLNEHNTSDYTLPHLARFRAYHAQQHVLPFDIPAQQFISFYGQPLNTTTLPGALEQALEVAALLSKPLTRLSGGELQRINLTRALWQVWPAIAEGQGLLVLDEPLQGLDIRHQLTFMALIRQLVVNGNTVVLSSHDLNISARFASHAVLLKHGRIVERGNIEQVCTKANLAQAFGLVFDISNNQNALQIQPQWPPEAR
ncbi:ATP-binding cassette domain-containing protein [Salinimonas marina]|uniref:ATP-binding cassette domain-containing protein n=1 Tax=Salinimonas marina TaxID=2785918 RepID=A0A7S9HC34_9ALTE|nr:ATP-binding cassette domain-containing protein [Salinimonas marina]QPG04745.1 ATP-binding cassette domain-containing protein [Salinimonas marina]